MSAVLAAAASAPADRVDAARTMLARCFVVVREADPSLSSWVRGLEAAAEERVLVAFVGGRGAALAEVLALVCWPEVDALVHGDAQAGALVMLRREAALVSARATVARGEEDPFVWLASISAERVGPAELGLAASAVEGR